MIGLDTNVLLRYIVRDDAAQARAASHLIEERCSKEQPGQADFADYLIGAVNASCGCEATFTLDKRAAKSGWHSLTG